MNKIIVLASRNYGLASYKRRHLLKLGYRFVFLCHAECVESELCKSKQRRPTPKYMYLDSLKLKVSANDNFKIGSKEIQFSDAIENMGNVEMAH